MKKKNQPKYHEHSEKTVTREAEATVLAKRWEESQEALATAARLERQESAYALAQYKRDYRVRKKQIILRELEDPYY